MASETAIVQTAGTLSKRGWSQVGRYGLKAIIRIQNAGIPVAIVHLIRSHVWRFLIEVNRNWSVSISACRSVERRRCPFNAFCSACSADRRPKSLIQRPLVSRSNKSANRTESLLMLATCPHADKREKGFRVRSRWPIHRGAGNSESVGE